jgi:hypothetical protein
MKESIFVDMFESIAKEVIGDKAIVLRKANLYYELYLNSKLELTTPETKKPKRGKSAFQTDICIFELVDGIEFPRVVIEFKEKITTHDILTYSAKEGMHKKIYPCLRYGILVSEEKSIPSRFFVHNEHLDFFIAAQEYKAESQIRPFAKDLIVKELQISHILQQIHFEGRKVDYYCREIIFQNFGRKPK